MCPARLTPEEIAARKEQCWLNQQADAVLREARERALRNYEAGKPTTIEYEIERAAVRRAEAQATAKRRREFNRTPEGIAARAAKLSEKKAKRARG